MKSLTVKTKKEDASFRKDDDSDSSGDEAVQHTSSSGNAQTPQTDHLDRPDERSSMTDETVATREKERIGQEVLEETTTEEVSEEITKEERDETKEREREERIAPNSHTDSTSGVQEETLLKARTRQPDEESSTSEDEAKRDIELEQAREVDEIRPRRSERTKKKLA